MPGLNQAVRPQKSLGCQADLGCAPPEIPQDAGAELVCAPPEIPRDTRAEPGCAPPEIPRWELQQHAHRAGAPREAFALFLVILLRV